MRKILPHTSAVSKEDNLGVPVHLYMWVRGSVPGIFELGLMFQVIHVFTALHERVECFLLCGAASWLAG